MELEDLRRVFGGQLRDLGAREWLDTRVGGLRTFIIRREAVDGVTFDVAVFTPHTRELDPFFSRDAGEEWFLDGNAVPKMRAGFVFLGCPRGILFAANTGEPSVEGMVTAIWDLAGLARRPWHPYEGSPEHAAYQARERRARWLGHALRFAWVAVAVALVLWLRTAREDLVAI